jgi:DNA-binding MarR family transcriptional regulator
MSAAPTPEACASRLVNTHFQLMCTIRNEMRGQSGTDLTIAQFRTLMRLHRQAGCNLSDLADDIGVSPPAMSKLIDGLVERGLVERSLDAADRRRLELAVSPDGRRALDRLRQSIVARVAGTLAVLSAAERTALHAAMSTLESALQAKEVLA